jgi:hypothetical protein
MSEPTSSTATAELPPLELVWGVGGIAAELNLTHRATYYLLESGALPVARKHRGKWVSSKPALRAHFADFLKVTAPDQGRAA